MQMLLLLPYRTTLPFETDANQTATTLLAATTPDQPTRVGCAVTLGRFRFFFKYIYIYRKYWT